MKVKVKLTSEVKAVPVEGDDMRVPKDTANIDILFSLCWFSWLGQGNDVQLY